jgi:hypothetical protein
LTALTAGAALAQENANQPPRDRAARHQERLDRVKEALAVTDEEWKALQPKVDRVMTLSMQLQMASMGFGGRGGRGGRGGENAPAPTSDLAQKAEALRNVLEQKDSKAEEVAAKLKAYREARVAARQELGKAQAALIELLTPRQEAALVSRGLLE